MWTVFSETKRQVPILDAAVISFLAKSNDGRLVSAGARSLWAAETDELRERERELQSEWRCKAISASPAYYIMRRRTKLQIAWPITDRLEQPACAAADRPTVRPSLRSSQSHGPKCVVERLWIRSGVDHSHSRQVALTQQQQQQLVAKDSASPLERDANEEDAAQPPPSSSSFSQLYQFSILQCRWSDRACF